MSLWWQSDRVATATSTPSGVPPLWDLRLLVVKNCVTTWKDGFLSFFFLYLYINKIEVGQIHSIHFFFLTWDFWIVVFLRSLVFKESLNFLKLHENFANVYYHHSFLHSEWFKTSEGLKVFDFLVIASGFITWLHLKSTVIWYFSDQFLLFVDNLYIHPL